MNHLYLLAYLAGVWLCAIGHVLAFSQDPMDWGARDAQKATARCLAWPLLVVGFVAAGFSHLINDAFSPRRKAGK